MLWRALIGTFVIAGGLATAAADERPRAFLELFTSQGCGACPAADRILDEFDAREGIVAVTMPVKLWDFLGWADTLATDTLTKRQMAYSVARGDNDVYTPQLVVNGKEDVLGSDAEAIEAHLDSVPEPMPLPIELTVSDEVLTIDVGDAEIKGDRATLWLLVIDERVTVPVEGGENRGRRLTYHNVVRHMRPVGMWKGEPLSLDLPLSEAEKAADVGCIVIAQVETFKGPGRIVGAAELDRIFPARVVK